MDKKKKIIFAVILICVLAVGGWKYFEYKSYCKVYYPANTIINGIDFSGMTSAEAKNILTDKWNAQEFVISENGKTIGTLKKMKFKYAIDDQLQTIMDKGYHFPLFTTVFQRNKALTVSMDPAEWTTSYNRQINNLPIYDQENPVKTENAYIDMSNHKFKIIPEVYGNNIDKTLLKETIAAKMAEGVWTLDYVEKDFYTQPTIKKDNEDLLAKQTYCNTYLKHKITYEFGENRYTISPKDMDKMMSADAEGKITINEKKLKAFVSNLADTYNTVGTTRAFKSTARGTVFVDGGTFGYKIDKKDEREHLAKDLKAMKDVSREPEYSQEGWGWNNNGFGSTYIEVDLACQQLWYYKGGQLVLTSPFVSGNVSQKHWTVTGAFSIVYMAQDVTLKGGDKKKGTDYESHVDYWMPFYGDYGLHDASWRSSFGGKIYLTGGSHGCVNMPPAMAEQLYYNASAGTPVIVIN